MDTYDPTLRDIGEGSMGTYHDVLEDDQENVQLLVRAIYEGSFDIIAERAMSVNDLENAIDINSGGNLVSLCARENSTYAGILLINSRSNLLFWLERFIYLIYMQWGQTLPAWTNMARQPFNTQCGPTTGIYALL